MERPPALDGRIPRAGSRTPHRAFVQHPQRCQLHEEIHARPPEPMAAGRTISHVVMHADSPERAASRTHLDTYLRANGHPPVRSDAIHVRADVGEGRLRWELHSEFATWTFSKPHVEGEVISDGFPTPRHMVSSKWLSRLPGRLVAGLHIVLLEDSPSVRSAVDTLVDSGTRVASIVGGGSATVHADFQLQADGFARMFVLARDHSPRQLGRIVQQLLEVDSYRMMALLGLPVAREASHVLGPAEVELSSIGEAIRTAGRNEEPDLLDRLTRLAAQAESHYAATHSRLSASTAYFDLVDRRLEALTEQRIEQAQTLGEFIDRRLSPARATCEWASRRQNSLSQRVARMSDLLRTRVEVKQQQSSKDVLEAMNARQAVQLELQATVEGLSIAAVTYYVVGLFAHLAKTLEMLGVLVHAELATAGAVPIVALSAWYLLRRLHHRMRRRRAG